MQSVIKYHGGKAKELKHFLKYIPDTFNRYIEPFVGGGALYFHLEHKASIINDINSRLINFYCELRDKFPEMKAQLDELERTYQINQNKFKCLKAIHPDDYVTNDNEVLYYHMRDIYNHPDDSYLNSVVYYFINKNAYSGLVRCNKKGEFNVSFGNYKSFNANSVTQEHSDLLKTAEIYNKDYKEIFELAKEDDFMFLDPPYDCTFTNYGNAEAFDESKQRDLAENFKNLSCRALMVIGKTPLTTELYGKHICDEYAKQYSVNVKNRINSSAMHIVVKNF